MQRVLFVTVGGSHQPVVTAIRELRPDRIIFVCSPNGSDKQVISKETPCEVTRGGEVIERLPNIPTQLNLSNFNPETDLILVSPDNLQEAYDTIRTAISQLTQAPDVVIKADYTGGTKTMSAALVLAALDSNCDLHLTTGQRTNITKIERGEATRRISSASITVQRILDSVIPPLQESFNYTAIDQEIRRLFQNPLSDAHRQRCDEVRNLALAFEAWDRFDHAEALAMLSPYFALPAIRPLGICLRKVIFNRNEIDPNFNERVGTPGTGYELAIDLLLNAERRAHQQRFDDAVARLYRALELLAQLHLTRHYQIDTGKLDLNKLPPTFPTPPADDDGTVVIGLLEAYELLKALGDPMLGKCYQRMAAPLKDVLRVRNYSLMAHGFTPISKNAYENFRRLIIDLLEQLDIDPNWQRYQFPTRF